MEILNFVVEAALATGFFGYLGNRAWQWWRRPKLSICFDPEQSAKLQSRRGLTADRPHSVTAIYEFVAVVQNDGRRTARSVEAAAQLVEYWDGNQWKEMQSDYSRAMLVWSGTHQTRAHVPPGGKRRDLAVFIVGPLEDRSYLHLAKQTLYTSPTPSAPSLPWTYGPSEPASSPGQQSALGVQRLNLQPPASGPSRNAFAQVFSDGRCREHGPRFRPIRTRKPPPESVRIPLA